MNDYRYIFQKKGIKINCPQCGKKTFVRYIDSVTGECCPEQYGRCDRKIKCGYDNRPKAEPKPAKAYFVPFDSCENYSDKSYLIFQAGKRFYIPKKMICEILGKGCFVLEWYLINTDKKPFYNFDIEKTFEVAFIPTLPATAKPEPQPQTPIPFEVLAGTLDDYDKNVFIQNLLQRVAYPFEPCDIEAVIAQYYLGTVASWGGAIALPYIDIENNIRAIQVKQFDEANHTTKTSFLHSILKYQYSQRGDRLPNWLPAYELNETKVSCLFGEHLLTKYPLNPVALVEAPKSAIYGTLYFGLPNVPDRFLWLAVYNLSSLNVAKCKALQGRYVVLFPDLSTDGKAFDLWSSKLNELNTIKGARFTISDLLESKASEAERANGCDIADYLICQDWRLFRDSVKSEKSEAENKHIFCPPQNIVEPIKPEIEPAREKSEKRESETKHFFCAPSLSKHDYRPQPKQNWTFEISELETYFAAVELPSQPVRLNQCSIITNVPQFIESHLSTLKANNGRSVYLPYLIRLQTLKQILSA
jgi:hypothetical protein